MRLINIHTSYLDEFKRGKYNKEKMWKMIAHDLTKTIKDATEVEKPDWEQCAGRWKTMQKGYNNTILAMKPCWS